jgi:GNAT superfamily N-acetyltransferase
MIIRKATPQDIPSIVLLGEKFFNESGFNEFLEYDYKTVIKLAARAVKQPNYAVFLAEDEEVIGLAAGIVFPFFFNENHITGQDFMWWVEPTTRGQKAGLLLFKAMQKWGNENADSFMMMSLEEMNPEKVGKFYEKQGYKLIEHIYFRRF